MACYAAWQKGRGFDAQGKHRDKRGCSVEGCSEVHFGRGYCRHHYLTLHYSPPKQKAEKQYRPCTQCGKEFTIAYESARFCSMRCYADSRRQPFIIKKGYKKVLLPSHPRADGKGYVFEHIIIAETMLGRPLNRGEEVHHKDLDRGNNSPENLEVCASHAEHMKRHQSTSGL
jgi:hypothetical protein